MSTTRFAPSPTGYLHLGHLRAAVIAWDHARRSGGRFLLRLEDLDPSRCRPQYAAAIQDDLRWLGLDWDGPVRVQSQHLPDYRTALDRLSADGLLYPCFCTRAEIQREIAHSAAAPHDPDGAPLYPGTCRMLPAAERQARLDVGQPHALRLDMAQAIRRAGPLQFEELGEGIIPCAPARFGDVVLARKDAPASYHLCVVHDDALQGVDLVTRAVDLKPATDLHRLLQALLGLPAPRYAYHALLTDSAGRRLAKRDQAQTLRALRAAGHSPTALRRMALGDAG